MANRDVIVVGASAGGVEALRAMVAGLPYDLPAGVLVVLHLSEGGHSALPEILSRAGRLPARHPVDGEPLPRGEIVVAPPDHHLVVHDGTVRLTRGPRDNGHRPAIDVLFRAAARWCGPRVIGVVLSGTLNDGTAGQSAVANRGGLTVVQHPEDALYPGMPLSVMEHVAVDQVVSAALLGPLLGRLSRERVDPTRVPPPTSLIMKEAALVDPQVPSSPDPPGIPAGLGCPRCGGSVYEIHDGRLVRYRCRVGHSWSLESLLAEQSGALESALWMALRTLEDRATLCRRSEKAATDHGHLQTSRRYGVQASEGEVAAQVMRRALEDAQRTTPDEGQIPDEPIDPPIRSVTGGHRAEDAL